MMKALFTSATGLAAQQTMVDSTSNNLANVNTTGFKRSQPDFEDLLYVTQRTPGAETAQNTPSPGGLQIGSGVRVSGNTKIFTQGTLTNSSNPLNVAIQGDGFFRITLPSGDLRYTRDGTFQLNATGNLVTADGYLVTPQITIPQNATSISIGTDGTVTAQVAGQAAPSQVGQISLYRFPNSSGLSADGSNLLAETSASGAAIQGVGGQQGAGTILQGYLEGSNVDVVHELVNLIVAQRAYEFNTRAVRAADDMLSYTTNLSR
jgi:flagellar basal-body rod protein FlgG